ncbi:MAG TPA: hypothetical protein VM582_08705 [Candidatus Thermoplasmatota archaeon]|nr:hypothetical protein [Candidatus Thermoplasmatota archaeon]
MHPAMRLLALTLVSATSHLLVDDGVPFLDRRIVARAMVNIALVAACGAAWLRGHV